MQTNRKPSLCAPGKTLVVVAWATLAVLNSALAQTITQSDGSRITRDRSGKDAVKPEKVDRLVDPKVGGHIDWCQTQPRWEAKAQGQGAGVGCGLGTCDTPSVRNSWIPSAGTPIRSMRIHFNVFCNSDGTGCAASQASVDAQMVQLNSDFGPSKIQFCYTTEFINNTTYRQFADSEEFAMKNTYADNPALQLNVYVVNISAGYLGVGTFPWDADALGAQGGLIIDDNWFGAGQKTLTHEVGHCVGLWHTHHGVSEVPACSTCYERANGVNGDITGDFASDTAPTPTNYNCAPPAGSDSCTGLSWGATDPQNYMGYAPDSCYTEFSPHQFGRMHCWSEQVLTSWSCAPVTPDGGCCVGQSCSIESQANCNTLGGTYLGDDTDCSTTPGTAHTYSATPNLTIPDGGGSGNPAVHTINVPDSFTIADVDVRTTITHTWVGDLTVTLQHGTTTVTLIDRPGYTGSGWGCSADNYNNIRLDDEGTAAIETQCAANLTSPPNYIPNGSLAAFDGLGSSGSWTIRVWDSATPDGGTLGSWSLIISEEGEGPCDTGCVNNSECDDGQFCNGAEVCSGGTCQPGTAPNCSDGVACTTDACNESTDSCTHTPNNAACNDGLFCNGSETCHATLGCQAGTDPCGGAPCNESTDTCDTGGEGELWVVFADSAFVPGVGTVNNEDIVAYDLASGTWSWIFDGSDVGLGAFAIDGLQLLSDGRILLSFTAGGTIGGISTADADIMQFTPTSLGSVTAGSWLMFFDGSDVGLTTTDEDVDAIAVSTDVRLLVSTLGAFTATVSGQDEDIIVFNATQFGSSTIGSFAMYFDGSDVGLATSSSEDVDAVHVTSSGSFLLSTVGSFSVTGASGTSQDIFEFVPSTLGGNTTGTFSLFLDLSTTGIDPSENVVAIHLVE